MVMVLVETAEVELKVDQVEVLETEATPMVVVLVLVVQMLILVVVELTEVMLTGGGGAGEPWILRTYPGWWRLNDQ